MTAAEDASERLGQPAPYAFVSLLTSDAYLPGALVLAHSLRATQPTTTDKWQLVCLCTPATLRIQSIKALRHVYDVVIAVEPLSFSGIVADRIANLDEQQQPQASSSSSTPSQQQQQQQSAESSSAARLLRRRVREKAHHNLALLGRPDLGEGAGAALTKLHLWRLNAYERVVYLDADMIALVRPSLPALLCAHPLWLTFDPLLC